MFKRREKKGWIQSFVELVYPKGGWSRAFEYVRHRLRRLPGTPEFIARGLAIGIFITFTPFFGFHMVVAVVLAYLLRGSVLAALFGTFFGNPVTFVFIGAMALSIGHWILGIEANSDVHVSLARKFVDAGADLWENCVAIFTHHKTDWTRLNRFWNEVFFPYLIGGLIPGIIVGTVSYYLSVPLIRAYQNRRKGMLKSKWAELKEKAVATAKGDASETKD